MTQQELTLESKSSINLLKTKQHFEILDGLRGVAAIAVVVFHFMEIAVPDYNKCFIAHAYLAVDFFFCLSGFVIAYAYDNRLEKIGTSAFLKLRMIRLHPLVVIGSIIGLLSFIFDPFSNLWLSYSGKMVIMFVTSCLMIPYAVVPERYLNLFHLNPPTWSLFWEYVINVVYAFVLVKLSKKVLLILTIVSAAVLVYVSHKFKLLSVGWGTLDDNYIGGPARVSFSFLMGMLIYRFGWIIKSKLGFIPVAVLTLMAFLFPFNDKNAWSVDPIIVIIYLPLMVSLGAGAYLRNGVKKICKFSGEISYPLYMVHYPFIWIFFSWVQKTKPDIKEMTPVIIVGTILLLAFAYLVLRFIDEPIRKYLRKKIIKA
ncbi:acyltransferase family protein [Pinibacter soli]|uniref:Acyltransferase n=1 Tax=Pinibacter soli TaxID=3044211 RepID=A0ABT6RJ50_9BACT|nr:acyltransferase [Pinibacter soli]MDI3322601.1 acyltransferase [Pinibacter soli]